VAAESIGKAAGRSTVPEREMLALEARGLVTTAADAGKSGESDPGPSGSPVAIEADDWGLTAAGEELVSGWNLPLTFAWARAIERAVAANEVRSVIRGLCALSRERVRDWLVVYYQIPDDPSRNV
jgi:hypothetical protein